MEGLCPLNRKDWEQPAEIAEAEEYPYPAAYGHTLKNRL